MPIVTVIITTYKRDEVFLKRAINSVLEQTFKDFQLLIVDDNGDNEYRIIVKEVVKNIKSDNGIRIIAHEINMGAQQARNTGIQHAEGEYIAFLDDDDEWLEDKLEMQVKKFHEKDNRNLGLVYCGFNKITYRSNMEIVEKNIPTIDINELKENIYRKNYIGSTSLPLIKKECFSIAGFFDLELKAKQDYDMWIRITKEFDVDYVEDVLCSYYAHDEERITNNVENKLDSELTFLNKYAEEIMKDNVAARERFKLIGIYYYADLNFLKAKQFLFKSVMKSPLSFDIKLLGLLFLSTFKIKPNNYIKQKIRI